MLIQHFLKKIIPLSKAGKGFLTPRISSLLERYLEGRLNFCIYRLIFIHLLQLQANICVFHYELVSIDFAYQKTHTQMSKAFGPKRYLASVSCYYSA